MITRLNIGGPARQALLLSRALEPAWRTTLVAGTPTATEGELTDPDVTVTRLPLVRPLVPRADARALAATVRLLRQVRPHVVHTHMAKAGTVGRLAAQAVRPRAKTVHTFHGHVLEGYFSPRVTKAFVAAERLLARRTDVLVAISDEIREELLDLGIGRPEQYRVIPLGFDLRAHLAVTEPGGVLRQRLGLAADVPLVGVVGRLVPIKNLSLLLEAFRRLDTGIHLAVVGDGDERPGLEAQARAWGLDNVHFTGWWSDVPSAMADLDVVALCSDNEGTPVSLIEAAACARASVATDVGGVRSVVHHEATGLLVPPRDPEALADAIARLVGDPVERARFGAEGRRRVGRYDSQRLVADIAALYDELVAPA
jgi:glycosyltransferase involved in cell wall biosynthesis